MYLFAIDSALNTALGNLGICIPEATLRALMKPSWECEAALKYSN